MESYCSLEACGVDADHIHLYLPKDAVGKVDLIHIFRRIVASIDINCITVQVQHVLWARLYEHGSLKKNMHAGWRRERPGQWDGKVMDWQDLWHLFTKESLREKTLSVPLSKTNKRYKDLDLNTKNKNHFSKSQYEQQRHFWGSEFWLTWEEPLTPQGWRCLERTATESFTQSNNFTTKIFNEDPMCCIAWHHI